jgi:GNAT superfamily N-acetyltransferase
VHINVRAALDEDEPAVFSLAAQFPTPTPFKRERFGVLFRSKLSDPRSAVLVAVREGELVGYVSGCTHEAFYAAGATAWVDEILVLPALRGGGVGRLLMSAFENWADGCNCVLVALATRGAGSFYERLGYASKAGYFKKYLSSPDRPGAQ